MIKRAFATAALLAAALLAGGEARAQSHTMEFYDVTEVLAPAPAGTVPTNHPDIPNFYSRGSDLAGAGALSFNEGDLRTYEFFAEDDGGAAPSHGAAVRIELLGAGADAYRLSVGALNESGTPTMPPEPSLSATTLTLSLDSVVGDLLRIRALRDDDLVAPAEATLRISLVSGGSISNLPLDFALTTIEAGMQLGVSDVTNQVRPEHTTLSAVAWQHSEANRVRGGDHLLLGEGAARAYVLRAPLGLFTLPDLSISLVGDGADQFKMGVGLRSEPNLDQADVSAANGEIVIMLMAVPDADADAATATLRITQDGASSPTLSNLPLELTLSAIDYDDADAVTPFVPGDTGRFILTPSVSEIAAGGYVSFDLAVDLGVSHGCKDSHCAINVMALEIVWDDADFILDTDAMDAIVRSDSTDTVYYEARGARRADDPANSAQPDTDGRLRLSQNPHNADYDILSFTRDGARSKLIMVLLDSFEDTDREIRCEAEDAASARYCGNFRLLQFGLFARAGLAVGEQLEIEAKLRRIEIGSGISFSLVSRGREVVEVDAVSPSAPYENASVAIAVVARGAASLSLTVASTPTLSTFETAEAPATVAFLNLGDAGGDALPTLLDVLDLKFAEDGDGSREVADMRMALSGPGLAAPIMGVVISTMTNNILRFDFSALADGGLLVADGVTRTLSVSAWLDAPTASPPPYHYEDRSAFALNMEAAAFHTTLGEREYSAGSVDDARRATEFDIDIVAQRLKVSAFYTTGIALTIPPHDALITTGVIQAVDNRGAVDKDYNGMWEMRQSAVAATVSAASYSFIDGESEVNDFRIDFRPTYDADNLNLSIAFHDVARELGSTDGHLNLTFAVNAWSLIAAAEPTLANDPDAGLSLSLALEAVGFYKQLAAGDCRGFARNCVLDQDFNNSVTITPSVGLAGQAAVDLAPVSVQFTAGGATLDLDLAAASLPEAGELEVTLSYPELQAGFAGIAVALPAIVYDFRRTQLAFEAAPVLTVAEASTAQQICVEATPANGADAAPIELSVALIGGDAVEDEDYTLAVDDTFSLSIGAGESRACQALTLLDDARAENDEHLEFQITRAAYAGVGSTVTELVRSEDTLRLVIGNDDDITVRIAPGAVEFREQAGVAARLNISLWDGANAARFSDDLGGRRELRFNIIEGTALLSGLCPANAETILVAGSDFCLRLPAAAAEGVSLSIVDTAGAVTFALAYQRNGVDRFVVEIVAPGGDALEGADTFEISIDGLDPSTDTTYVWQTTAAAPNLGDDNLSVAMSIRDAEEAAPVLVGPDGQALTAVTLLETTPSVVFHVELREAGGTAALVPDEDVGVEITLGDLPGVSFVDLSTSTVALSTATRTLNLVIAANATRTASFRLLARADDNDVSESGTLDLLARSGGATSPLPADAMASVDVTVMDADASAVPFVLDYDQSGNVNISDGLILGRLMAGVIAFETNLGPNFNRFFAENAPPGTLVADSMLLNVISEDATADAAKLLSDRTLRDEALQSVLFIYFNYSDDLDLDKSGNLNISDGLILGRLVAGVIAAEVSFGPGFPNFFNPDGSLNKGLDPGTLDLFYVDVEADATGILPNEAVRREAIEKVLEIYVRAGFSFTD